MPAVPPTTIRLDTGAKAEANKIFDELGIGMSAAVNAFLKAVVRERGIPFDMKIDNAPSAARSRNTMLNQASMDRKDEFYTQYEDVAMEMENHTNAFEGARVLCNCDDPFESPFFRFFAMNFNRLGLERLTTTSYAGSSLAGNESSMDGKRIAYKAVVETVPDESLERPNGSIDLENLFAIPGNSLTIMNQNGDFRSEESVRILESADIVVTNPPFSLFREYIGQLLAKEKQFLILGNMNAATYREVFPLFRDNKIRYGNSIRSGDRKFHVPEDYPLNAAGCGVDENGRRYIQVKGVRWFTNLQCEIPSPRIALSKTYSPQEYPNYENYEAIEVGRTLNIPSDYKGIMGVPITFLDKYNPEQFEIIMLANGNARTNTRSDVLAEVGYRRHPDDRGGVGILNGRRAYARIMIRRTQ